MYQYLCYIYPLLICGNYPVEIKTKWSSIEGIRETIDNEMVNIFLGIPYADPPTDDYRFTPPDPLSSTRFLRYYAGTYRSACMDRYQSENLKNTRGFLDESEDCLYLNVWSPKDSLDKGNQRPVVLFIHDVASDNRQLDGKMLAILGNITVVTFNYRSGLFGLIEDPDSPAGIDSKPAAYYDTRAALDYIRENIEHFGGDPNQITILADGWEAIRIALLLETDSYNQLIFKNGPLEGSDPIVSPLSVATKIGEKFSCSTKDKLLSCLRKIDTKSLHTAYLDLVANGLEKTSSWLDGTLNHINDLSHHGRNQNSVALMIQINTQQEYRRLIMDEASMNIISKNIDDQADKHSPSVEIVPLSGDNTDNVRCSTFKEPSSLVRAVHQYMECPLFNFGRELAPSVRLYSLLVDATVQESAKSSLVQNIHLSPILGTDLIMGEPIMRNDTFAVEAQDISYELIHIISDFIHTGAANWSQFLDIQDDQQQQIYRQYRFNIEMCSSLSSSADKVEFCERIRVASA
ncbi:liver carboxylesterase 1-like [Brevipalpus obovatus]|uniref:liver carboxylesterase 1-like n=1 Tax=Brevipalpus obovatus TaxID=246614 RepID=UPI003D9E5E3D